MAAISNFPTTQTRQLSGPIIRGDPLCIPVSIVRLLSDGTREPIDISDWILRAHVRRSYDAALIMEFAIEIVTPDGGTVPNQALLSLDTFQTAKLKTGYVFDLEQLIDHATPETWRTWWIIEKIFVHKDVSHE
jgi:hypothetical protein